MQEERRSEGGKGTDPEEDVEGEEDELDDVVGQFWHVEAVALVVLGLRLLVVVEVCLVIATTPAPETKEPLHRLCLLALNTNNTTLVSLQIQKTRN